MSTPLTAEMQRLALRPLIELALREMPSLNSYQRADMYEALAVACTGVIPTLMKTAQEAATALRDAEARQLTFQNLLQLAPQP